MDTIMTLWQLRSLMCITKKKFQHFDWLYQNTIKHYQRLEMALKFAKAYVKEHNGEKNDNIYRMSKTEIRHKLAFAQDEIRMHKNEMQKWRDISTRLERAYWSTYRKLDKVWHVTEDGEFGRCISNRFIGADTKLHLRIVGYNSTGRHQVIVSLLDPKFGVLTNEHVY